MSIHCAPFISGLPFRTLSGLVWGAVFFFLSATLLYFSTGVDHDGKNIAGGSYASYAGRDNGRRDGGSGYAGREDGEFQFLADIPDNHCGQWKRVSGLGGNDVGCDRGWGANPHILLPSIQRI